MTAEVFSEHLRSVLGQGHLCRFIAPGFSMAPFIKHDDVVTVAPGSRHSPRVGNIVAFMHPGNGKLYVHRIISRAKEGFLIKGDNLLSCDGIIPSHAILGVVIYLERRGKRVIMGLGYERMCIALLSRVGVFPVIMYPLRWLAALWRKK